MRYIGLVDAQNKYNVDLCKTRGKNFYYLLYKKPNSQYKYTAKIELKKKIFTKLFQLTLKIQSIFLHVMFTIT